MLFFLLRSASLAFSTCCTSFASVCCVSRWLEPQSFWLISYRSSSHSLLDSSIGSPYLVAHLVGLLTVSGTWWVCSATNRVADSPLRGDTGGSKTDWRARPSGSLASCDGIADALVIAHGANTPWKHIPGGGSRSSESMTACSSTVAAGMPLASPDKRRGMTIPPLDCLPKPVFEDLHIIHMVSF